MSQAQVAQAMDALAQAVTALQAALSQDTGTTATPSQVQGRVICTGTKADGSPCGATAKLGTDRCRHHPHVENAPTETQAQATATPSREDGRDWSAGVPLAGWWSLRQAPAGVWVPVIGVGAGTWKHTVRGAGSVDKFVDGYARATLWGRSARVKARPNKGDDPGRAVYFER